jgi:hypothetical protein
MPGLSVDPETVLPLDEQQMQYFLTPPTTNPLVTYTPRSHLFPSYTSQKGLPPDYGEEQTLYALPFLF